MPGGGKICAAYGCSNRNTQKHLQGKVSFHAFPFKWGKEYVKAWQIRLKRADFQPSPHMVVCSEHFEESCFEYQNFTGRRQLKRGSEPTIFKHNEKKERPRTSYQFKESVSSHVSRDEGPKFKDVATQTDTDVISDLLDRLNACEKQNVDFKSRLYEKEFTSDSLISRSTENNDLMKTWTGFSKDKFIVLFQFFCFVSCIRITNRKSLSPKNQFLMCLIKLRHGLKNSLLSFLFHISTATVSRVFNEFMVTMYTKAKTVHIWPPRDLIQKFMPIDFHKSFSNTRVIIDCCEYFIEQPRNPLHQQASFSTYKNHNTLKALIGIAPSGAISFISELYMGSISDKQITIKSGLLDLLEEGDLVLADKGFTCLTDLFMGKKAILKTPHFLKQKDQFNLTERGDNKNISHLRVHVERAINRIKNFKILDQEIDYNLLSIIEEIHFVTCFLTLFLDPLINNNINNQQTKN